MIAVILFHFVIIHLRKHFQKTSFPIKIIIIALDAYNKLLFLVIYSINTSGKISGHYWIPGIFSKIYKKFTTKRKKDLFHFSCFELISKIMDFSTFHFTQFFVWKILRRLIYNMICYHIYWNITKIWFTLDLQKLSWPILIQNLHFWKKSHLII